MDQERLHTLLTREIANELTETEAAELQQLLQQYPHASYIREIFMKPWRETGHQTGPEQLSEMQARHLQRLQATVDLHPSLAEENIAPLPQHRRRWWRATAIAASIALLIAIGWKIFSRPAPAAKVPSGEVLATAKGIRSQLMLPDGSHVWLNAGSKLNYPKSFVAGQPRIVELEGEAFFDVATNANWPFQVKTKAFTILVLGTSFNVRAYPEEDSAVTSLVNGSVEVQLDKDGKQKVMLHPNEKLTVPSNLLTSQINTAATEESKPTIRIYKQQLTQVHDSLVSETAWVKNKLAFKHLELDKVTALLEQWYGVEIGFHDQQKKQLYFTGVFETNSLDAVLEALTSTGSFTYTKDERGKIWIE
ncbi:FecR domain-containing protein [Chitinophaga sp.]|uniref:FecR domain-containing protein n=1 Tax=Chitinophaga sp. TaxID=1869181 RepID=UPI0031D2757C